MEQQMNFKIDYCKRKKSASWCERNFNSLPHKMLPLSWSFCMCKNKNDMLLYWLNRCHGFTMGYISCTKGSARYSLVTKCKYDPILGKYNYWVIMDVIDKVTDE